MRMIRNRNTYFTVRGRGEFPWDMLRYDQCWPTDESDICKILPRYETNDPKRSFSVRDVRLGSTKNWMMLSRKRWESFGWAVIESEQELAEAEGRADVAG